MGLKGVAVPNFEAPDGPHQANFPAEPSIVPEIGGYQDAALAIQEALLNAGNQEPLKSPQVLAKERLLRKFGLDFPPLRLREGQDVTAEIGKDDLAILELPKDFPVAGRNADPSFVIHGVEVATGKHDPPLIPTIFHFFPHGPKIRPLSGICQEKKNKKRKSPQKKSLAEHGFAGRRREVGSWNPASGGVGAGLGCKTNTRESVADGTDYVTISKRFSKNA
jgi:hypothetical protein